MDLVTLENMSISISISISISMIMTSKYLRSLDSNTCCFDDVDE